MLMLGEFRKHIKFFMLMSAVLVLLMSVGVSIFNFAFEINKQIYKGLEDYFDYGHSVNSTSFYENTDALKKNGVSYVTYRRTSLKLADTDDAEISCKVYQFENYLPKNFESAINEYDDFVIAGSLWTAADNKTEDGKYLIFLSDSAVSTLADEGITVNVGSVLALYEMLSVAAELHESPTREFIVKAIYKKADLPYSYSLPDAAMPVAAAQDFRQGVQRWYSGSEFVLNSVDDYKSFAKYAKKTGLNFYGGFEDDIAMIAMFSAIFSLISIIILSLCGIIAFVYCGMFINKRINFIGLLKALGMTNFNISKQFFVLLSIVFGISFLLANVFSIFLTRHFAYLAFTLFEFDINTGFNFLSQAVFALLSVLTVFLSAALLNRRISKISISKTLIQKE